MYNNVSFQTSLTFPEQKRIIQLIPGLQNVNIVRYGVIHRNTYIESPKVLNSSYQVINKPNIFFAGQISGVEGYVESAASGLNVAIQVASLVENNKLSPDRKSTRLNSSHVRISYAVFCLKKNNTNSPRAT